MKKIGFAVLMIVVGQPAVAKAEIKACEDLKNEIAAKLDKKGVKGYTLDVVTPGDVKDSKMVVGSCEGGTKRIVYINKRQ